MNNFSLKTFPQEKKQERIKISSNYFSILKKKQTNKPGIETETNLISDVKFFFKFQFLRHRPSKLYVYYLEYHSWCVDI